MDNLKKILAPTDLSELSAAGIRFALGLAKTFDAEVTVYHVVDREELLRYGSVIEAKPATIHTYGPLDSLVEKHETALSQFLKASFGDLLLGLKIIKKVELGSPEKNIVEEAKNQGSDLIVMSTHGRTGLSHMLVGSVTEKVVRTAPCPVLSIHPVAKDKAAERLAAVA